MGAEGGGGPGCPRVRWRYGRRQQRGRAATRPPCMGWISASPLLLHARGGSGWGRAARAPLLWEPPARCLWPVPPRLPGVLRAPLRFEGCSGRRSGERAPAAVWVGGYPRGRLGRSQARLGAPRRSARTEVAPCGRRAPGGLPTHARGWPQRTEPDRHLPLLGKPWTVRPPETPRSPAKLNCPALGAPGPAGAPGAGCSWLVMGDREKTWLGRVRFCPRV